MPSRRSSASDDHKSDTNCKSPADLEEGGEGRDAERTSAIDSEANNEGNAEEDVEEDAGGLGHAFAQLAGAAVFEVEFALGDKADVGDVAGDVSLDCFGGSDFQVVGCEAVQVVRHCDVRVGASTGPRCQ